ncbi:MAG: hypothetical protein R3213_02725 [Flavobacteriaceae bacterium]|nr:hypothetical protein [Flavobacteriaceae bacterium]
MSKSIQNFLVTLVLGILLLLFLPWWAVMLAGFFATLLIPLKSWKNFIIPFLAIALYWTIYGLYLSAGNDFTLTKKIGVLFSLGENWFLEYILTAIIGGIAAGVSGLFGKQVRALISPKH